MILAHVPDSRRDKPMHGELANMTNAMQCATSLPARSKGAAVAALAKQCGNARCGQCDAVWFFHVSLLVGQWWW